MGIDLFGLIQTIEFDSRLGERKVRDEGGLIERVSSSEDAGSFEETWVSGAGDVDRGRKEIAIGFFE